MKTTYHVCNMLSPICVGMGFVFGVTGYFRASLALLAITIMLTRIQAIIKGGL